jgi:hypothetical protein
MAIMAMKKSSDYIVFGMVVCYHSFIIICFVIMLLSLAKGKPACDSAVFFWSKIIPVMNQTMIHLLRLSSIQLFNTLSNGYIVT